MYFFLLALLRSNAVTNFAIIFLIFQFIVFELLTQTIVGFELSKTRQPLRSSTLHLDRLHGRKKNVANELNAGDPRESVDLSAGVITHDSAEGRKASLPRKKIPSVRKEEKVHLPLTKENVEIVLDKLRPNLVRDGGNIELVGIENGVVIVQFMGACNTCSSSEDTLKLQIEKTLKDRIPAIVSVVRTAPEEINVESVNTFLAVNIKPYLELIEANIEAIAVTGTNMYPVVELRLAGLPVLVDSIKDEIVYKLRYRFNSALKVKWLS